MEAEGVSDGIGFQRAGQKGARKKHHGDVLPHCRHQHQRVQRGDRGPLPFHLAALRRGTADVGLVENQDRIGRGIPFPHTALRDPPPELSLPRPQLLVVDHGAKYPKGPSRLHPVDTRGFQTHDEQRTPEPASHLARNHGLPCAHLGAVGDDAVAREGGVGRLRDRKLPVVELHCCCREGAGVCRTRTPTGPAFFPSVILREAHK